MLKGRISNINGTKYIVETSDSSYDCVLRGIFRKEKIIPLVGDNVEFNEKSLQIMKIFSRRNYLTRPNIANVDIALIITSTKKPDLDLILLDKLLVNIISRNIEPLICFTKIDLLNDEELKQIFKLKKYYEEIGIKCITSDDINNFEKLVSNKIVVTCGQTGAGKSTFINKISPDLKLATSPISESLNRGVHTTRYVSLYKIKNYFIADTPGFSALNLDDLTDEMIRDSFIEFANYECKYRDCNHINTDGCKIINNNKILTSRYENYIKFIKEKHENSSKLFKK